MPTPTPTPKPKETITLESLNEKVDQILKYQKHVRRVAIARFIFSFIFFMVFVVLPIMGSVYLFKYINEKIDVNQAKDQFFEFQDSINSLNEKSKQLDGITNVNFDNLKGLLN